MFGPLVPNFLQGPAPLRLYAEGTRTGLGADDAVEQAILKEGTDTVWRHRRAGHGRGGVMYRRPHFRAARAPAIAMT